MATYTIYWTKSHHYSMDVEGDSNEEVIDNFYNGEYLTESIPPYDIKIIGCVAHKRPEKPGI